MMNRRRFLRGAVAATVASTFSINVQGANERVLTAVMGIYDRGMDLAKELVTGGEAELRYFADPDNRLFDERADIVQRTSGKRPKCVQDFRRILDDPEVDALCIATPDHWHALAAIMACQAGKDVYVEKPTSHSIWESRKMVEAARKHDRVVQVGTQNLSADYCQLARERVNSADFGDVHFVRIVNSKQRGSIGRMTDGATPPGVELRPVARPRAGTRLQREPLPLPMALVLALLRRRFDQRRDPPDRLGPLDDGPHPAQVCQLHGFAARP